MYHVYSIFLMYYPYLHRCARLALAWNMRQIARIYTATSKLTHIRKSQSLQTGIEAHER